MAEVDTAKVSAAACAAREPDHELSVQKLAKGRSVSVMVRLPGVSKLSELNLEVSDSNLRLDGCGYKLDAPLPFRVDAEQASAKFSSKSQRLKVTVPEA